MGPVEDSCDDCKITLWRNSSVCLFCCVDLFILSAIILMASTCTKLRNMKPVMEDRISGQVRRESISVCGSLTTTLLKVVTKLK